MECHGHICRSCFWVGLHQHILSILQHVITVVLTMSCPSGLGYHTLWPRNGYIKWPERFFLIEVIFILLWLKLCFPLKCFWVISFISCQSVVLNQIIAWQIVVPCISLFTSETPISFSVSLSVATLSMVWNVCIQNDSSHAAYSVLHRSLWYESFYTLERAAES